MYLGMKNYVSFCWEAGFWKVSQAQLAQIKSAFRTDLSKSFFYPDTRENLKYTDTYVFSAALASLQG